MTPTRYPYADLPQALQGGVQRWIEERILPGDFLTAVLENNLTQAFARADEHNRARLFEIVGWFYNEAPSPCWGSVEKVRAWQRG